MVRRCIYSLKTHLKVDNTYNVWQWIQSLTTVSSPVDGIGAAGGGCEGLALVRYGYQRTIWVWVHMCSRLTSVSSQPSFGLKDVDDHQLSPVSRFTNGLLWSSGSMAINELPLLITISFTDASSDGFHSSTGNIELVYRRKLGELYEILLDRVFNPYADDYSWYAVYIETISCYHTCSLHLLFTSRAPYSHPQWLMFQRHQFYHFQTDSTPKYLFSDPKGTNLRLSTWSHSPPSYGHNQNRGFQVRWI